MNFSFSEEQQLLADTARSYARDRFGSAAARAWMAGEWKDFDSVWHELGEMGWLGLLVPEDLGGGGGSIADACILLEELARALAPVPFEGNAIVAASALRWLGASDLAANALSVIWSVDHGLSLRRTALRVQSSAARAPRRVKTRASTRRTRVW